MVAPHPTSQFRFRHTLQPMGSGSGESLKKRARKHIKKRDPAYVCSQGMNHPAPETSKGRTQERHVILRCRLNEIRGLEDAAASDTVRLR